MPCIHTLCIIQAEYCIATYHLLTSYVVLLNPGCDRGQMTSVYFAVVFSAGPAGFFGGNVVTKIIVELPAVGTVLVHCDVRK